MGECQSMCTSDYDLRREREQEKSSAIEYDGRKFIISDNMNFQSQATFGKVEMAARQFCRKNNIPQSHTPLVSRIIAYRHEFVFEDIWNRMSSQEREEFLDDLNSISHDLMDSFYFHFVLKRLRNKGQPGKLRTVLLPKTTRENQISEKEREALVQYGQDMLVQGKVAMVFMCAGSSSRFDGEDKFLAPFNVGTRQGCMLDFLFYRLRKNAGSNRALPIVINCNNQNITRIQNYLKKKGHFGFTASKFRYTTTYSLAVFDQQGKYCLSDKMRLIQKPSGTAACAESVLSPGINKFLRNEGVQYVCFSGMENLLENPADPLFLGIIMCEQRKVGAKCVNPIFQTQSIPRYYSTGDKSDRFSLLGAEEQRTVSNAEAIGGLPVAMNSMVFELKWLVEIVTDYNNNLFLAEKYRVLAKTEKVYNTKTWKLQLQNCFSFEKDIRDFLTCVDDPILFKVERGREYAPICSRNDSYCLHMAIDHFQPRLQAQLEAVGH